jgi:hypothetical protein
MPTRRDTLSGLTAIALTRAQRAAAQAVQPPPTVAADEVIATRALRAEGRYLPLYDLARTGKSLVPEQNAAFCGDEALALSKAASSKAATDLSRAQAHDAVEAIVRAAAGRRVVMLNEAHVASRHRAFLGAVLRRLREDGFTHLAAETFSTSAETLRSGDPVGFPLGWYTADPVYAEAVREALQLGFQLVAYEQRPDQTDPASPADVPTREQAEAVNFAAALRRWPQGRFIVHVGYSHIGERPDRRGVPWFAARLKAMTGIDPLTISQADTGSFGPHGPDSGLTLSVLERFRPTRPLVLWAADGSALGTDFSADLAVFHPALADVDGRPGWLAADPSRRPVQVDAPADVAEDCIAQAVRAADPDPAIPADQYVLPEGSRRATFFLQPGRYRIRLETRGGIRALGDASA